MRVLGVSAFIMFGALTVTPGLIAAGDSANQPVRADLATMVEEVVKLTGVRINISHSTPTSVNIDQANGRNVCIPEAHADVERLQRAFDAHKSIYRLSGPTLISITDRAGEKTYGDRKKLEAQGILKGCTDIYVSVHE